MTDTQEERCIALRFWGGELNGQVVRFTFPEILFSHLKDTELVGSDGSTVTPKVLFDNAETVDFLAEDVSPQEHLSHGTSGAREKARLSWEVR